MNTHAPKVLYTTIISQMSIKHEIIVLLEINKRSITLWTIWVEKNDLTFNNTR